MAKKKRHDPGPTPPEAFKVNPFAGMSIKLPAAPSTEPVKPPPAPALPRRDDGPPPEFYAAPLTIRHERKGRGGKTVTVIAGFAADFELEMQELAGTLRRRLGTGGTLKENTLELQGDHRLPAADWLREQGFKVRGDIPTG